MTLKQKFFVMGSPILFFVVITFFKNSNTQPLPVSQKTLQEFRTVSKMSPPIPSPYRTISSRPSQKPTSRTQDKIETDKENEIKKNLSIFPFLTKELMEKLISIRRDIKKAGLKDNHIDSNLNHILNSQNDGQIDFNQILSVLPEDARPKFKELVYSILQRNQNPLNIQREPKPPLPDIKPEELAQKFNLRNDQKLISYPDGTHEIKSIHEQGD